ncbi:MFS transporter [Segetibacter aerophilus]|uniref:Hexuronate transporter n=1 Tax=Segetibacter aerophilus TaxID=670293 RepID=A0A512BDX1_9BACT|nr:MFS transporter [Segetibacter aerophilus]GEO10085.1 hexuronate transporter [Segetibacter aerophilus]
MAAIEMNTGLQTKIGKYRWTICALVFYATTINYLDRQVISLLKPTLEKEFNWTESDYSNIVVAFQFAYAIGMVFAGRFIDKIGTKIGYALTLTLWSIASILHAFATGTVSFAVFRAFLGVTEAGNFPAAFKTVAEWFPKKERAFAGGIFNSGTNVGAILAPLLVPWLAINYSWKIAFIAIGAIGFIWLIFWFMYYEIPSKQKRLSRAEFDYIHSDVEPDTHTATGEEKPKITWTQLLGFKQTWAFIVGKFLTDGIWWFFLFWLPAFLNSQYHLVGMQVSLPIAFVYTLAGVASVFGGWLPMWFVKEKGWDIVKARKTSMLIYAFFPLLVMVSQAAGSYGMWYAVVIIGIAASAHQAWSANLFTTVSDMFPKNSVASVVGIGGMAGGLGGMAVAKVAGLLFDHYKALGHIETGYYILFLYCGLGYLAAWFIMFRLLVPKMKPIEV